MGLEVSLRQRENLVKIPRLQYRDILFFLRPGAFSFNFRICALLQNSRKRLDKFLKLSLRVLADYIRKVL